MDTTVVYGFLTVLIIGCTITTILTIYAHHSPQGQVWYKRLKKGWGGDQTQTQSNNAYVLKRKIRRATAKAVGRNKRIQK